MQTPSIRLRVQKPAISPGDAAIGQPEPIFSWIGVARSVMKN
jgi:hypothetical protein